MLFVLHLMKARRAQERRRRISGASVLFQFRTLAMKALELAPRELMRLLTPAPRPARSSCRSPTCVPVHCITSSLTNGRHCRRRHGLGSHRLTLSFHPKYLT